LATVVLAEPPAGVAHLELLGRSLIQFFWRVLAVAAELQAQPQMLDQVEPVGHMAVAVVAEVLLLMVLIPGLAVLAGMGLFAFMFIEALK
jgi:hypothetical protein